MANGYYIQINASESSYNITSNTSNVSVSIKAYSPVALAYGGYNFDSTTVYVTCNGIQKSFVVGSYDFRASTQINLGTISFNDIQHNNDGSKTISISTSWYTDNPYVLSSSGSQTLTASSSLALTTIPRQAILKTAPDFNDEANPTITYNNIAGTAVSSLQACISLTGSTDNIAYRDVSKTSTSYTFMLTESERNILRNATTNANSRSVMFYLKTVINGNTYYSTLTRTLSIVNANPILSDITYADNNASVVVITTNNQLIVQNKSSLRVNFARGTLLKGATLTRYSFILNGVTKTSTSASGYVDFNTINSASNLTLQAILTDSRGNQAKRDINISIVEYSSPTAIITLNRLNNYEDTTYLTVDGAISSVNDKNVMAIQYQYKLAGGSYGALTTIQDNVRKTLSLDKNNDYVFKINVSDSFGSVYSKEVTLNKGVFPLFIDTSKNSVGVNTFPLNNKTLEIDDGGVNAIVYGLRSGTFTPTIAVVGETNPTVTYTTRNGSYVKIGSLIYINVYIRGNITALRGTNNYACITGLPFTAREYNDGECAVSIGCIYNALATPADVNENTTMFIKDNMIRIQRYNGSGASTWKTTPSGSYFEIGLSGIYQM